MDSKDKDKDKDMAQRTITDPYSLTDKELFDLSLRELSKSLPQTTSTRATFSIYLRWLEVHRELPPKSTEHWINTLLHWSQALRARGFRQSEVVAEVASWKEDKGPFRSQWRRYPPTPRDIAEAYHPQLYNERVESADEMGKKKGGDSWRPPAGNADDRRDDRYNSNSSAANDAKKKKAEDFSGSPPSNYTCNRCNQKGHYLQVCPTNLDPTYDRPPAPDYICEVCHKKGEHFKSLCPENRDQFCINMKRKTLGIMIPPAKAKKSNVDWGRERIEEKKSGKRDVRYGRLSDVSTTTDESRVSADSATTFDPITAAETARENLRLAERARTSGPFDAYSPGREARKKVSRLWKLRGPKINQQMLALMDPELRRQYEKHNATLKEAKREFQAQTKGLRRIPILREPKSFDNPQPWWPGQNGVAEHINKTTREPYSPTVKQAQKLDELYKIEDSQQNVSWGESVRTAGGGVSVVADIFKLAETTESKEEKVRRLHAIRGTRKTKKEVEEMSPKSARLYRANEAALKKAKKILRETKRAVRRDAAVRVEWPKQNEIAEQPLASTHIDSFEKPLLAGKYAQTLGRLDEIEDMQNRLYREKSVDTDDIVRADSGSSLGPGSANNDHRGRDNTRNDRKRGRSTSRSDLFSSSSPEEFDRLSRDDSPDTDDLSIRPRKTRKVGFSIPEQDKPEPMQGAEHSSRSLPYGGFVNAATPKAALPKPKIGARFNDDEIILQSSSSDDMEADSVPAVKKYTDFVGNLMQRYPQMNEVINTINRRTAKDMWELIDAGTNTVPRNVTPQYTQNIPSVITMTPVIDFLGRLGSEIENRRLRDISNFVSPKVERNVETLKLKENIRPDDERWGDNSTGTASARFEPVKGSGAFDDVFD